MNKLRARTLTALLIVAMILPVFTAQIHLAFPAITWQDGFESGDHTAWDSETGTVDINQVHVYTGNYAANVTATGPSDDDHYLQHDETGSPTVLHFCSHYYLDVLSLPSETYPLRSVLWVMKLSADGPVYISIGPWWQGTEYVWAIIYSAGSGAVYAYTALFPPEAGSWYGLELALNKSGNWYYEAWINGTSVFTFNYPVGYSTYVSNAKTGSGDYAGANSFDFSGYFDDCVVGDDYLGCPGVAAPAPDLVPPNFLDGDPALEIDSHTWETNIANETSGCSVNVTDNAGVSGYIFSYMNNTSDTWQNGTWTVASGRNVKVTGSLMIPDVDNETFKVHFKFYANDTSNNWAVSSAYAPAVDFEITPVIRMSELASGIATFTQGNKPGSRRVYRAGNYFVAFWLSGTDIQAATSTNAQVWASQGTVNHVGLSEDDLGNWAAFAWGSDVYCAYYDGHYQLGYNDTLAYVRSGSISKTGAITWTATVGLITLVHTFMYNDWPTPDLGGVVYGYWSFAFCVSRDETQVFLAMRCSGEFANGYTRVYFLTKPLAAGSWGAFTEINQAFSTQYSADQIAITSDPSYDTGLIFVYDYSVDVRYRRWDGSAWIYVNYPYQESYEGVIGTCSDWSVTYMAYLKRAYFSGTNRGTYYFADDPAITGRFVEGGPTVSFGQINMATDHTAVMITAVDGQILYYYRKEGAAAPGETELASWKTWQQLRIKSNQTIDWASTSDYTGPYGRTCVLFANYTASYGILAGLIGSPRFSISIDITDLEGCGNWVFAMERYYHFNMTVTHAVNASTVDTILLRFTTPTKEGDIINTFTYVAANWSVAFSPATDVVTPTRTQTGAVDYDGSWLTGYFCFRVWFTMDCLDVYKTDCVDIDAWINDTAGFDSGWATIQADAFKIYSQGGFSMNTTISGDAGIIGGGGPFSLYARNDSLVYNEMVYRNLQHVKLLPEVTCVVGYQTFYIQYGMDYCLQNEDWVPGWYVRLGAEAVTYGTERWINFTISWWDKNSYVTTSGIYFFHRGDVAAVGGVTAFKFWVDLWFDKINSSTTGGGRVNAYEYPMKDGANPWLRWLSSNWGPKDEVAKDSMFMCDLRNTALEPVEAQKIKLVRVWSQLEVMAANVSQQVFLTSYEVMDLSFCNPPLIGVQTPVFDETKVPLMPQGGFLGALSASMSWWGKWLSDNIVWGGLSIWPSLVAFLDTIAAWLGYPSAFSNFVSWIGGAWSVLMNSMGWLVAILGPVFGFLATFMGKFITLVALAATYFGQTISGIFSFIDGTAAGAVNVWTDFNLLQWVILGIIIYPIYLVIMWDEEGLDAVEHELRRDWWIVSTIGSGFIRVGQFIVQVISTAIESIPVAE